MTRRLKRGKKRGFPESDTNGRYYLGHQIPIAREQKDMTAMLVEHLPRGTMIEVLIHGNLTLPNDTAVVCYSDDDVAIARDILDKLKCTWKVEVSDPPGIYPRSDIHAESVKQFIDRAMADPNWRGNGLEFDRLR